MSVAEVTVRMPEDQPRAGYALGVLLDLLGLRPRASDGEAQIVYGAGAGPCRIAAGPATGWDEPRPQVTRDDGLPIVHLPGGPAGRRADDGALGFDVLYATFALLTGPWETADPVDEVGCPIAK